MQLWGTGSCEEPVRDKSPTRPFTSRFHVKKKKKRRGSGLSPAAISGEFRGRAAPAMRGEDFSIVDEDPPGCCTSGPPPPQRAPCHAEAAAGATPVEAGRASPFPRDPAHGVTRHQRHILSEGQQRVGRADSWGQRHFWRGRAQPGHPLGTLEEFGSLAGRGGCDAGPEPDREGACARSTRLALGQLGAPSRVDRGGGGPAANPAGVQSARACRSPCAMPTFRPACCTELLEELGKGGSRHGTDISEFGY
ncbi:unnamed protein product [Lampetra fluviatilis]